MASSTAQVAQQLAQLREAFGTRLPNRVNEIVETWNAIQQNGWTAENGKRFHRLAHSLAGAAATFGFPAMSQSARELELYLEPFVSANATLPSEQRDLIAQRLGALQSPDLLSPDTPASNPPAQPTAALSEMRVNRSLLLVTRGNGLEELVAQLGYFDYQVRRLSELGDVPSALQTQSPAAILIDADLFDSIAEFEVVRSIRPECAARIPLVFISARGDLATRVASVRAGADAYFSKPVTISRMVDKLDQLTAYHPPDPYRILIVEDDEAMAYYYALTLRQAGMETNIVRDPTLVLQQLMDWRPDLILMDLYMPYCTGWELARVIRQQEAYVGIPIVYLSGETRREKQLAAMSLGGDDFLTKPILPEHLVASVTARAERSHILRSLILRDSLTGLLNHTAVKGQLETEILRAKKNQTLLAYAMVDIDHFKHVNDTYGHATGDGVLKTLARLLQQRLRMTDVIGRYGGEEFAVILPEAEAAKAQGVLDEIRLRFSQIRHQCADAEFAVTFSAGIAAFPACGDANSLNYAADRALYQAKQNGRNQITLA